LWVAEDLEPLEPLGDAAGDDGETGAGHVDDGVSGVSLPVEGEIEGCGGYRRWENGGEDSSPNCVDARTRLEPACTSLSKRISGRVVVFVLGVAVGDRVDGASCRRSGRRWGRPMVAIVAMEIIHWACGVCSCCWT
jgi:hypothetical protein